MHLKNAFICMRINNKISGTLLATKGNATHYLIIYNHFIKKNAKSFLFHVKYLINYHNWSDLRQQKLVFAKLDLNPGQQD